MGQDDELRLHLAKMVDAFHILHHKGILDFSGTVSIRHPFNGNYFFTSITPPNVISSPSDLLMFNVNDGKVTHSSGMMYKYLLCPRYSGEEPTGRYCMYISNANRDSFSSTSHELRSLDQLP